jgi:hypothetical protein
MIGGPWTGRQRATLAGVQAVGLLVVWLGWWGASGATLVNRQLGWLNLATAGLIASGVANTLWLRRGRHAVTESRRALTPLLAAADEPSGPVAPVEFVSGPGMTTFHRRSCPLAAGKDLAGRPRTGWEAAGLSACPVCEP